MYGGFWNVPGHTIMTVEEADAIREAMRQSLVDGWNWLTDKLCDGLACLCIQGVLWCWPSGWKNLSP
jgi:hypothetical protein